MRVNISRALKEAEAILRKNSIESAGIDAKVLLSHCLGRPKSFLFAHPEHVLSHEEQECFSQLVERRSTCEPVAYITGEQEFWSRSFLCTPQALIPRPETELVVETAIGLFQRGRNPMRILDLATGTGCIGITLAAHWQYAETVLTDVDFKALMVAKENCRRLLDKKCRVFLLCSDWFDAISSDSRFDLITVNPPYVSRKESGILPQDVIRFEPHHALFSQEDGLSEIRKVLAKAGRYLAPGGAVICEIGWKHGKKVLEFTRDLGLYSKVSILKDLSGHDRVATAYM